MTLVAVGLGVVSLARAKLILLGRRNAVINTLQPQSCDPSVMLGRRTLLYLTASVTGSLSAGGARTVSDREDVQCS
jgi:hypothetical protein